VSRFTTCPTCGTYGYIPPAAARAEDADRWRAKIEALVVDLRGLIAHLHHVAANSADPLHEIADRISAALEVSD
jgi:hypothetical protein